MKFKILISSLLIVATFSSPAQLLSEMRKINPDSLQQLLPGLHGKERIDVLNRIALGLSRYNPDTSILIGYQTYKLSESIDYQKGRADGLLNIGHGYFYRDSIKPMVLNYLAALRIYEELEPCKEMGFVLEQLMYVNRLTGRYMEAKKYCFRAIKTFNLLSLHKYELAYWINLGVLFTYNQQFDSAFYCLDHIILVLDKYPDDLIRYKVFANYAWNYSRKYTGEGRNDKEEILKAISWSLKAVNAGEKLWTANKIPPENMVIIIGNTGSYYIETGIEEDIKTGVEFLKRAKSIRDTIDLYVYPPLEISVELAKQERKKGNNEEAIALLKSGLAKTDSTIMSVSKDKYENLFLLYNDKVITQLYKKHAYDLLYQIYKEFGDYKTALEYFILKVEAEEKIFSEENRNLIIMLEADSENERTDKKITLLARDNELKDMRVKQSRILNIGVGMLFLILIFIGLLFLRQNRLKNEHKSTLLEQKLLRLQMNPHFIFNAHSNILSFIEKENFENASRYLSTFSRLLRSTLESSRHDTIMLDEEISILKDYLEMQRMLYDQKFEYDVYVDEKLDPEDISLPPMLIQPFIENAIHHGIRNKEDTGHVNLRFLLKGNKIACEVEDDGIGRERAWQTEFSKTKEHKSLATTIITERIRAINKKLNQKIRLNIVDLKSEQNKPLGTKVVLDLPLVFSS